MSLAALVAASVDRVAVGLAGYHLGKNPSITDSSLRSTIERRINEKIPGLSGDDQDLVSGFARNAIRAVHAARTLSDTTRVLDGRSLPMAFAPNERGDAGYNYWTVVVSNNSVSGTRARVPVLVFSRKPLSGSDIRTAAAYSASNKRFNESIQIDVGEYDFSGSPDVIITSAERTEPGGDNLEF